jgi:putative transposase
MTTNIVNKGYKLRVYLTKNQNLLLSKSAGCARLAYNYAVSNRRDSYKAGIKKNAAQISREFTELKKSSDMAFMKEVPAVCLFQSLRDADTAYKKFFKKETDYPAFKSKDPSGVCSIRMQDCFMRNGKLILPKFGEINVNWIDIIPLNGNYMMTLSRDATGKCYISFQLPIQLDLLPSTGNMLGIDVGLLHFYHDSNNETVDNPRYLKRKQKALKRSQRALERSINGSKHREKKRLKTAKLHAKVANQRRDFHHKLSKKIVEENDVIVVENLKIKNMLKNHRLAGGIADAGWGQFRAFIAYKAGWYGKTFIQVSPAYTSRDCHICGHRHEVSMSLDIREWTCSECGAVHDRDHNAAINILNRGLTDLGYIVPRGTGELTDVDIISAGEKLHATSRETMVGETSICGLVMCDADRTSVIAQ